MCSEAMRINPAAFFLIPDHFNTHEMCIKVLEVDPRQLHDMPDHFKTQEMCNKAVKDGFFSLQFVPDWFVTQQQMDVWYDDDDYYDDDKRLEWYDGYQKRKAEKAKIKDELMPIASHPARWWGWCVPEDEKKDTEKLWK